MVSFPITKDYASLFLNYDNAIKEKDYDEFMKRIKIFELVSNPNHTNMKINMFLSEKGVISSKLFKYLLNINFDLTRQLIKMKDYNTNPIYKYTIGLNKIFSETKFKIKFDVEIETTGEIWYINHKNMIYDENYIIILNNKLIEVLTNMSKPVMMRI